MKWQPIANAPVDGRMMLLWIGNRAYIGNYNVARQFWCKEEFPYTGASVTYWMPLPSSPEDQTKKPKRA